MTFKVTTNITSILCRKERWREENGYRLLKDEQADGQKQLPSATDHRLGGYYGQ